MLKAAGLVVSMSLQTGPPALELSMLDRPDFVPTMEHVWDDPPEAHATNGPHRFEGMSARVITLYQVCNT